MSVSGMQGETLEALLAASAEPLVVAQLDRPDWPVVFTNPAFEALAGEVAGRGRPLADVVEQLIGREHAVEISETVRSAQAASIPVEWRKREYLLVVQPIAGSAESSARYCGLFWRNGSGAATTAGGELHQALMRARRRIRDLSRDDPVTGLLNETAFREVLAHDWAVAAREQGSLALVRFSFDEFPAYLEVFGRHATHSCLRRVAQALRRHLKRASDVAARISRDGEEHLVVLAHASGEDGAAEFARQIAVAVRDLGLHHPRSRMSRFVTVSHRTGVVRADAGSAGPDAFLDGILED